MKVRIKETGEIIEQGNYSDIQLTVYNNKEGGSKKMYRLNEVEFLPEEDKIQIVPSGRIDYCSRCGNEHGYECPLEDNKPLQPIEPVWTTRTIVEEDGDEYDERFINTTATLELIIKRVNELSKRL